MTIDDSVQFKQERIDNIQKLSQDFDVSSMTKEWVVKANQHKYSYNFDWLGLPIIQYPQDIIAIQEIIWRTKPNIIIETGVARGGSLILSASILHLLNGNGTVIGIDIDIREHNRIAIENHPLSSKIKLINGSSIDCMIIEEVKSCIGEQDKVMVILDSNHTHDHVLRELELYSPFVTNGCYMVVMDTIIENLPIDSFPDRPWNVGNNPYTAVKQFLKDNDRFQVDEQIHSKLAITVAFEGYLKCIK